MSVQRRTLIKAMATAAAASSLPLVLPGAASAASAAGAAGAEGRGLRVRGVDISSLAKSEALGGVYRDEDGRRGDAVRILAEAGVSHARLKCWVNPADGYNTKRQILPMARRLHAAGVRLMVDFHYSDTWADPGKQFKPAAWAQDDLEGLKRAVYDHTADVLGALAAQGTPAALVQIGNELNGGMLWPDGDWNHWEQLAALLKSGIAAAHAVSPRTRIVLHLANGGDNGLYRWWFDNAMTYQIPFDVIGASFYPYWHGPVSGLAANLADVSARYDKDVLVAETGYPFRLDSADSLANMIDSADQLVPGYPATPAGQQAWVQTLADTVAAVPNGRGLGYFYWEGTWTAVPGNGWDPADPASGNAWENQALFDFDQQALPALHVFGERHA
ncbi:arabinogalactan endo-1,4-beta-galactosidase [Streptacidiphilus sp. MAP12-20]|uniref:glycoside hydrolase family 53 protein n=1 Tax=Streptacidiphilus sp. MAP12-20 TaxID=3156299 RepID=UPI00351446A0